VGAIPTISIPATFTFRLTTGCMNASLDSEHGLLPQLRIIRTCRPYSGWTLSVISASR